MPGEFARDASQAATALRGVPRALAGDLPRIVRRDVAEPLADRLRAAGTGSVYARLVARTVTVTDGRPPVVAIGGPQRLTSGGATGEDLVYGTEYGGGARVGQVRASRRARAHRRRTTRQFLRQRAPFIEDTVARAHDPLGDQLADTIAQQIEQATT
jgi:hypothetical protein